MAEQKRTHEIFSEPAEARVRMAERLIESLIDDETDSEIEAAWKEEARQRLEESRKTPVRDVFREMREREISTRRFRMPRDIRLAVARELIDSLDELDDAARKDFRDSFHEATARSVDRILFTLG